MSDPKPSTADPAQVSAGYQVKSFIDASQLRVDMEFNPNDLTDAFMRQSSMFVHYGVLAAEASRQVDMVKLLLENAEAAVYQMERKKAADDGEKITEALLSQKVSRHKQVISMKKALAEAKRVEAIGKTAVEGFRHRRDMLIQQGLISREEMKGELQIRDKQARQNVLDQQRADALDALNRHHNATS